MNEPFGPMAWNSSIHVCAYAVDARTARSNESLVNIANMLKDVVDGFVFGWYFEVLLQSVGRKCVLVVGQQMHVVNKVSETAQPDSGDCGIISSSRQYAVGRNVVKRSKAVATGTRCYYYVDAQREVLRPARTNNRARQWYYHVQEWKVCIIEVKFGRTMTSSPAAKGT